MAKLIGIKHMNPELSQNASLKDSRTNGERQVSISSRQITSDQNVSLSEAMRSSNGVVALSGDEATNHKYQAKSYNVDGAFQRQQYRANNNQDLSFNNRKSLALTDKPSGKIRIAVAILTLIVIVLCQSSRMILNVAIVSMVNHRTAPNLNSSEIQTDHSRLTNHGLSKRETNRTDEIYETIVTGATNVPQFFTDTPETSQTSLTTYTFATPPTYSPAYGENTSPEVMTEVFTTQGMMDTTPISIAPGTQATKYITTTDAIDQVTTTINEITHDTQATTTITTQAIDDILVTTVKREIEDTTVMTKAPEDVKTTTGGFMEEMPTTPAMKNTDATTIDQVIGQDTIVVTTAEASWNVKTTTAAQLMEETLTTPVMEGTEATKVDQVIGDELVTTVEHSTEDTTVATTALTLGGVKTTTVAQLIEERLTTPAMKNTETTTIDHVIRDELVTTLKQAIEDTIVVTTAEASGKTTTVAQLMEETLTTPVMKNTEATTVDQVIGDELVTTVEHPTEDTTVATTALTSEDVRTTTVAQFMEQTLTTPIMEGTEATTVDQVMGDEPSTTLKQAIEDTMITTKALEDERITTVMQVIEETAAITDVQDIEDESTVTCEPELLSTNTKSFNDQEIEPITKPYNDDDQRQAQLETTTQLDIPVGENSHNENPYRIYVEIPNNANQETSQTETKPANHRLFKRSIDQTNDGNGDQQDQQETPVVADTHTDYRANRMDWSMSEQSALLGAFYYSYAPSMLLAGGMAEKYGAKYMIGAGLFGTGFVCLLTPWLAQTSYALIWWSRVMLGLCQAGIVPGTYALFSVWLTPTETGILAPMLKVSLALGSLLGAWLPSVFIGDGRLMAAYNTDWPHVFYTCGCLCLVLVIAWFVLVTSKPQQNRWIGNAELAWIWRKKPTEIELSDLPSMANGGQSLGVVEKKQEASKQTATNGTPWLRICTTPTVIVLFFSKLTYNIALDFFIIQMPTCMAMVHGASVQLIARVTMLPLFMQVIFVTPIGWLAQSMIRRRTCRLSRTKVRKLFQAVACFGIALAYVVATTSPRNLVLLEWCINVLSFVSMFSAGGDVMIPFDLSQRYPATIMAVVHSLSVMSGIIVTKVVPWVLNDEPTNVYRWAQLMNLSAAVCAIGGLVFVLVVKAKPVDFDRPSSSKNRQSNRKKLHTIAMNP